MGQARRGGMVCVVGSVHMDIIATAARLPARGESLLGERVALHPGGKAGNQAAQAALLGAQTFLVGRVGRDLFGDQLRAALQAKGVDVTYLAIDEEAPTGASPVFTGADGEYASIIVPGASQRLGDADLLAAREAIARAAVLLIQAEIPLAVSAAAARLARAAGVRVLFNASPVPADPAAIPPDLWAAVDLLLANGLEAARLSGMDADDTPTATVAAAELRRRLAIPAVVLTLGAAGTVAVDDDGAWHQPAFPVEVVETIGAGDAFAGALASELARGASLRDALPLAAAAGAMAVTRPGAFDALADGAEIRAFLAERGTATPRRG